MESTKLYNSLRYLDVYELTAFDKFINSPYFNQNENLIGLYRIFLPYLKGRKDIDMNKYQVWEKLFMNKDFDDKYFRKLTSDLSKLLERYLAQQIYEENNVLINNHLLQGITRKNAFNMYNSALSNAERLVERNFNRNADYYYQQYQLEKSKFNFTSEFEKKSKKQSKVSLFNIKEISDNLDIFFISEKLKLYCTLLSARSIKKIELNLNFIEEVIQIVNSNNLLQYPSIAVYYQIYLTLIESVNEEHYHRLKIIINKNIHLFPPDEANDIYESALNYCIRKANSGRSEFYNELLALYKDMLEKNSYEFTNKLNPTNFRNIVFTAARVNDFKWAEWFINEYKEKLDDKYRDNAVTYNLARLNYYKKDYDKVKKYLRDVEFDDMGYELNAKTILIITYYDTDDYDPLYSLLESFNMFLNRNKKTIPDQKIKALKTLIKFVKRLMNIRPSDQKSVQKLKQEIENAGDIPDKQWLLDRVSLLEK
jgi:hypothetical protein